MEDGKELDDAIISLTYYNITSACILMQTMTRAVRNLKLDHELTKQEKYTLKHDGDFTSRAVLYLTEAGKYYRQCLRNLDLLNAELDTYVSPKNYDLNIATVNEIMAVNLLYMHKTNGKPDVADKIRQFILDEGKPTGESFKEIYDALMKKARTLEDKHFEKAACNKLQKTTK